MGASGTVRYGFRLSVVEKVQEERIIHRASAGDKDAFGELYDRYYSRVFRYIFFRVADSATAEDLASAVFLKAWEKLEGYRVSNRPFIAWLYTIAHNSVIDHYRMRRTVTTLDAVRRLRSPDGMPEEQFELDFESETLRRALLQLTRPQRDVVAMRHIQGMDTDEIARRIGKSAGAVRALQMRALQALAKLYKEQGGGTSPLRGT